MAFPADKDHRTYVPWEGIVVRNDDPEGLHRAKVRIPGFIDETRWAFPLTSGGGSAQRGGHLAPAVGSIVVVWFMGGDVERPRYKAAGWGKPSAGHAGPKSVADAGDQGHLVQAMQVGPMLFTVDERPRDAQTGEGQRFTITDLNVDKVILEYDFELQGWTIEADYLVNIVSGGIARFGGIQTQINGRTVKRGTVRQV